MVSSCSSEVIMTAKGNKDELKQSKDEVLLQNIISHDCSIYWRIQHMSGVHTATSIGCSLSIFFYI